MHHKSLESQIPYTGKGQQEISDELNKATSQLANPESKVKAINWEDLVQYGFEDIDSAGFFTGKNPKFKGV